MAPSVLTLTLATPSNRETNSLTLGFKHRYTT